MRITNYSLTLVLFITLSSNISFSMHSPELPLIKTPCFPASAQDTNLAKIYKKTENDMLCLVNADSSEFATHPELKSSLPFAQAVLLKAHLVFSEKDYSYAVMSNQCENNTLYPVILSQPQIKILSESIGTSEIIVWNNENAYKLLHKKTCRFKSQRTMLKS